MFLLAFLSLSWQQSKIPYRWLDKQQKNQINSKYKCVYNIQKSKKKENAKSKIKSAFVQQYFNLYIYLMCYYMDVKHRWKTAVKISGHKYDSILCLKYRVTNYLFLLKMKQAPVGPLKEPQTGHTYR
jgi:hypothetical protein